MIIAIKVTHRRSDKPHRPGVSHLVVVAGRPIVIHHLGMLILQPIQVFLLLCLDLLGGKVRRGRVRVGVLAHGNLDNLLDKALD